MCRLMAYLGTPCLLANVVTKPSRSLTRQSYDAKERLTGHGYLNGDGFGIGWYSPESFKHGDPTPCVFTSIQPAWNNLNLERLANKIISPLIFAHVRAAYPGMPVNDANCQPFICGRYIWMHNGGVAGFHTVRRKLLNFLSDEVYQLCPSFESDSAVCFALFLNMIGDRIEELPPEELVAKMQATINEIMRICNECGLENEQSLLNFVVSDGKTVVSTRYCNIEGEQGASLYYASGSKFERVDSESNDYSVRHGDRRGLLGMVASEPLTEEKADWIRVPRNTMVVMSRYKGEFVDLLLIPIHPPPAVSRDISRSFKSLASCSKLSTKFSIDQTNPSDRLNTLSNYNLSSTTDSRVSSNNDFLSSNFNGSKSTPIEDKVQVINLPRHSLTGHNLPVLALAIEGNRLFTGSEDCLIRSYDLSQFKLIKTLSGHDQTIFSLAIHDNRLYSSSTRVVKIWDLKSYQLLSTLSYSDGDVFALALAQGRAIAGPAGTSITQCNRRTNLLGSLEFDKTKTPLASVAENRGSPRGLPRVTSEPEILTFAKNHSNGHPYSNSHSYSNQNSYPTSSGIVIQGFEIKNSSEDNPPLHMNGNASSRNGEVEALTDSFERLDHKSSETPSTPIAIPNLSHWSTNGNTSDLSLSSSFDVDYSKSNYLSMSLPVRNGNGIIYESDETRKTKPEYFLNNSFVSHSSSEFLSGKKNPCKATKAKLVLTDPERLGHCSRVYALEMCSPFLCSGGGDAFVKVWDLESGECKNTLYGHKGSVMALAAVRDGQEYNHWKLLSGSRDNTIRVWDLTTFFCITTLTGHTDDVLALSIGHRNEFFSASTDHTIRMWSLNTYECLTIFIHEEAIFLSLASTFNGVVSGSSDGVIRCWETDIPDASPQTLSKSLKTLRSTNSSALFDMNLEHTIMEQTLHKFMKIKTVRYDCTKSGVDQTCKGAKFVMSLLEELGAESKLIVCVENTNPVVFGRIMLDPSLITVTICGCYDTMDASPEGWNSPPFDLTAVDGYLYGRGVSNCKGPLICTLFAISELVNSGELKVNINFVFNGMQESGSVGFKEAVLSNLEWFEGTGLILTSNGAWLSDHNPCLIYGMRGLIFLNVIVQGPKKNLHSGSDGGAFNEPMNDLITVLSNLIDSSNMILIPGFYDDVKPQDSDEDALYDNLNFNLEDYKATCGLNSLSATSPKELLHNLWRYPSLSIVGINSDGMNWSLIPKKCIGKVCIRYVPNQNPQKLIQKFEAHITHEFAKLRSRGNTISVSVEHVGDWWLADPTSDMHKLAESAIEKHWGVKPMYIREGGTMAALPFLEKTLGAPALHLPISQASDHMALQNEKLSWKNFVKGKDVIRDFIASLGA